MRNLICIVLILFSVTVNSQQYSYRYSQKAEQEKLNSVSLEYGLWSSVNLALFLGSSAIDYFVEEYGETLHHTGHSTLGPLGVSYSRTINRFELGASFWYSHHGLQFSGYNYGTPTVRTYGFLLDASFLYLNSNNLKLYSGFSIGPGFISLDNIVDDALLTKFEKYIGTAGYIASHINLFGIRYGKDIGVSFEGGFGHKGILRLGVDYKF